MFKTLIVLNFSFIRISFAFIDTPREKLQKQFKTKLSKKKESWLLVMFDDSTN